MFVKLRIDDKIIPLVFLVAEHMKHVAGQSSLAFFANATRLSHNLTSMPG